MPKGKLTIIDDDEIGKEKKIKKQKKEKIPPIMHNQSISQNYEESLNGHERIHNEEIAQQQQRKHTKLAHLAICFPDSILEIPQTSPIRAYFISQIARISSIFKVDEIVILRDHSYTPKSQKFVPSEYIARNLQYLETPQYLRKNLFKMHPDLNNVGLMNPIQASHHLKTDQACQFRDGVALQRPTKHGSGSWVDIGLKQQAKMDVLVLPLTRVTLRLKNYEDPSAPYYEAEAVSKRTPRAQKGLYWGYDVRIAQNLKQMVIGGQAPYDYVTLCNHTSECYDLPQIQNFSAVDLQEKSLLIYFSGMEDLGQFISKDLKPKWQLPQALKHFNYAIKPSSLGVKQLRLQEQLFLNLSKLVQHTL